MKTEISSLEVLGWNSHFQEQFEMHQELGQTAGRVSCEFGETYRVYTIHGELAGCVSGKLRFDAKGREDLPAVGDWTVIQPILEESKAIIHHVLPRQSLFIRKTVGERTEAQVVGANIDIVFLVTSLNQDFNLRRIERYLVLAWESGAMPVIVLSKADLCSESDQRMVEVQGIAGGVPVHAASVVEKTGLEQLVKYLGPGKTGAMLGSSGVGKSTLINEMIGSEVQRVQAIREDDGRGRHTTTRRELIRLPSGGLILDTPGMRELQLWEEESGIESTFEEIESLAMRCRFRDCSHRDEPDCAVREALRTGELDSDRYRSYEKLGREVRHLELKRDALALKTEKQRWKKLTKIGVQRGESKRRGFDR